MRESEERKASERERERRERERERERDERETQRGETLHRNILSPHTSTKKL